jgi:parallel beta-helix repeat protein/VCBS repeat-containing protein
LAGTYAETVKPNSGTAGNPVTFSAAPGVTVTGLAGNSTNGGAFRITLKSYIVVDGFTITRTADYGIILDTSNHITISNNHVSYAGTAAIHRIGIYLRVTTDSTISGNTTDHNTMDGIRLNTGSNNNTVSNNVSFGNAEGTARNACGINVLASNSNTIIHNTVYANEDTGLNFETGSHDNLVVGNLTYGNGDHGIHNNAAPNNTIIGNTVQGNVTVGINLEGASSPGSGGATVMNNVMVDNGLLRLVGGGTSLVGSAGNIRVDAQSLVGTTLDSNLYYLSPAEGGTRQIYWGGGSAYTSLAAFQAAQPTQEVHGLQANPRLAAPAPPAQRPPAAPFNVAINVGNYHLTAGSAAIDSANASAPSEPALDLEGKARVDDLATTDTGAGVRTYDDRGAYEFVGYALTVTTGGTGTGSVTSTPSGISCPGDCTEAYNDGTGVTLTAAPAVGSTFTGWSGACTGTGSCVVTIDAVKTVTATFTVAPLTAVADTYAATEDMAATTYPTVLANDTGTDGTAVLITGVSYGTLTFNANGTFTYKPAANYNGPDSFTYKATNGAQFSVATVTINVAAVNDAPVAQADTYNVKKNTKLTVAAPGVLANDTDVDGLGMTAVLTTNVTKGTLALSANGSFTYTPATNATGNVTFSYKAKSTAGLLSSAVTVTLVVK